MLFPICIVNADATDYKITYDITDFRVKKNGEISIEGWSALSHMDNFGGTNGNMVTKIIAYIPQKNKTWGQVVHKSYPVTFTNNIDFYSLRCSKGGCGSHHSEINKRIGNSTKILEDGTCIHNPGAHYSGTGDGSHCAYNNLGFKVTLNIDDIVKDLKITSTTNVKFAIYTRVYYGKKLSKIVKSGSKQTSYKSDSSDLGIIVNGSNTVCRIYGKKCVEGEERKASRKTSVYNIEYEQTVKVSGLSNYVYFSTLHAKRYNSNSGSAGDGEFTPNRNYKIQDIGNLMPYYNEAYTRRIKIGNHWAYMFWVKPSGGIILTLTPAPEDKPPCGYCVGSGCQYDKDGCPIKPNNLEPVSCSEVTQNSCSNMNYNDKSCSSSIVSDGYYYRISASDFSKKFSGYELSSSNSNVIVKDGYYYFPVTFAANVTYKQSGNLIINDFQNNQVVSSGRSFPYSFQYNVSSSWDYRGNYDIKTGVNNTFKSVSFSLKEKNTNKGRTVDLVVFLGNGDVVYKKDGNNFASPKIYTLDLLKDIVSESVKKRAKNPDISKNTVIFGDSNDISKEFNVSDAGNFNCTEGDNSVSVDNWIAGRTRNLICNYKIKKAFFNNNGDGNVLYSDSDTVTNYQVDSNNPNGEKSLYYVPVNLKTGEQFHFKVNALELSLIDGFNVEYNAVCNVVGKNEIHNKIKYRSIDTSNPFPDSSKISKNWEQYIKDYGLNRITLNSFSAISYQTNIFRNRSAINNLKNVYGDYYSYGDMSNNGDGTSSVIHSDQLNLFSRVNGNHCTVGRYNSSCDRVKD